jgi:hypothetical protein
VIVLAVAKDVAVEALPDKLPVIVLVNVFAPEISCEFAVMSPATVVLAAGIVAFVPVEDVIVPLFEPVVYPRLVFAAAIEIEPAPFVIVTF